MRRKLVGVFSDFGFAAGLLYLIDRLLRSLSPRLGLQVYELMVQPVSATPLLPPARTRQLSFAEILPGDPAIERMSARTEIKAQRFEQGANCLGVYRKGQWIGYIWFRCGSYDEDEVRCTYVLAAPEHSAFDFDLVVLPEHRMGTAFASIWHAANEYLRERGIHATYSRMTRFNLTSRNAHARLGSRRVGQAVFLQAWALEVMLASVRPYAALSWSRRVRLTLPAQATDSLSALISTLPQETDAGTRPADPFRVRR